MFSQPSHCSKHGGLAIYVDEEYTATLMAENSIKTNVCEGMFLEISGSIMKNKLLIGNIYKPPKHNNNDDNIITFLNDIEQTFQKISNSSCHALIAGDFNINLLEMHNRHAYSFFMTKCWAIAIFPK